MSKFWEIDITGRWLSTNDGFEITKLVPGVPPGFFTITRERKISDSRKLESTFRTIIDPGATNNIIAQFYTPSILTFLTIFNRRKRHGDHLSGRGCKALEKLWAPKGKTITFLRNFIRIPDFWRASLVLLQKFTCRLTWWLIARSSVH